MTWPETFGDTTAEYVAVHDEAGFVGETLAVFWAVGPDAVTFLQGIITQDVQKMAVGEVARSFLLGPRGKLQALLWVLRGEDRVGLVTDGQRLDETLAELSRWRIRVEVEFEIEERETFEVLGSLGDLGSDDGWIDEDGVLVVELGSGPIRRRLVAGKTAEELTALGMRPVGQTVATITRIETGEPRMGIDVDERTIPQETGLVAASVSFTKGCYLGQELVARIDTRGHVNRHLRAVRLVDAVIPPVGAEVRMGDATIGVITSVGESLAIRAPLAMALIRREAEPGAEVEVVWESGSSAATVEAVPLLVDEP